MLISIISNKNTSTGISFFLVFAFFASDKTQLL
jgi:hypothetical protein